MSKLLDCYRKKSMLYLYLIMSWIFYPLYKVGWSKPYGVATNRYANALIKATEIRKSDGKGSVS